MTLNEDYFNSIDNTSVSNNNQLLQETEYDICIRFAVDCHNAKKPDMEPVVKRITE